MTLIQQLKRLQVEVRGNVRLRRGFWLLGGVLWLYGLLLLQDAADASEAALRQANERLARLEAQAADTAWPARRDEARAQLAELEKRLWYAGTLGLARAAFQDALNAHVQQAGLARAQVSVAAQEEKGKAAGAGELWKVSGRIVFDFHPKTAYPLLQRLEGSDKRIVVESLVVRGSPVPRAEMVVAAWFRPAASPRPAP